MFKADVIPCDKDESLSPYTSLVVTITIEGTYCDYERNMCKE